MRRGEWHDKESRRQANWFERIFGLVPWRLTDNQRLLGEDGIVVAEVKHGGGAWYGIVRVPVYQILPDYATAEGARLSVEERLAHLSEPHPNGYYDCKGCRP